MDGILESPDINSNKKRLTSVKDMTQGSPLKLILTFSLPLLLGNIFQQMYNMVDSIIVGQFVGKNALAAVGATGSLNFLAIGSITGLCLGFCIPISQSFGAKDFERLRKCFSAAIRLSIYAAVILTLAITLSAGWMLNAMQTPAEIIKDSYTYIFIIFAGIGGIVFYNLAAGILRALGDSKTPLIFLIVASLLNVVLDLLLVVVFKMGVAGAAYATVFSQAVSGVLCLVTILKQYPFLRPSKKERKRESNITKQLLWLGLPMALQFSVTSIGTIIVQYAVNGFGTDVVAAVSVGSKIQFLLFQPMETIGITMATYCGQNMGAKRLDRIRQGVRMGLTLTVSYAIVAGGLSIFFGPYIALLFVKPSETGVLKYVSILFKYSGAMLHCLGVLFVFRNTLQGLGYAIHAMFAGILELFSRSFVALFLVKYFGYNAICIASPSAWLSAVVWLLPVYFYAIKKLKARFAEKNQTLLQV